MACSCTDDCGCNSGITTILQEGRTGATGPAGYNGTNGTNGAAGATGATGGTVYYYSFPLQEGTDAVGGREYLLSTSASYETMARFIYQGATAGPSITAVYANVYKASGAQLAQVALIDSDGLTVAESATFSTTTATNVETLTINAIPAAQKVIYVKVKVAGGETVRIASVLIKFGS